MPRVVCSARMATTEFRDTLRNSSTWASESVAAPKVGDVLGHVDDFWEDWFKGNIAKISGGGSLFWIEFSTLLLGTFLVEFVYEMILLSVLCFFIRHSFLRVSFLSVDLLVQQIIKISSCSYVIVHNGEVSRRTRNRLTPASKLVQSSMDGQ